MWTRRTINLWKNKHWNIAIVFLDGMQNDFSALGKEVSSYILVKRIGKDTTVMWNGKGTHCLCIEPKDTKAYMVQIADVLPKYVINKASYFIQLRRLL